MLVNKCDYSYSTSSYMSERQIAQKLLLICLENLQFEVTKKAFDRKRFGNRKSFTKNRLLKEL